MLNEEDRYTTDRYFYVCDADLSFDIDEDDEGDNYDHLWYIGNDDCFYIDTYYEEND